MDGIRLNGSKWSQQDHRDYERGKRLLARHWQVSVQQQVVERAIRRNRINTGITIRPDVHAALREQAIAEGRMTIVEIVGGGIPLARFRQLDAIARREGRSVENVMDILLGLAVRRYRPETFFLEARAMESGDRGLVDRLTWRNGKRKKRGKRCIRKAAYGTTYQSDAAAAHG
jgi:hypothetical protein